MQRYRWISVPKTQEAVYAFYEDNSEDQFIEIRLNTEKEFDLLYESGIFLLINKIASCMIDDYEEEEITDPVKIKFVIKALINEEKNCSQEVLPLVVSIRKLFKEALHRGTGVYFFF
ncbi:hypothetical protein [Cardinium endosymbiont of Nabis limbatus]|uniref:hypothetical protein n=1 Tax=Cardinium endosymbiont of Nabis limbatus TaxID=3066217 RepID=UPI003AF35D8C